MRQRCLYPKSNVYHLYGGAGITICDRWNVFENFLSDMGEKPDGMSLDRYPNKNGNYEPSNCRWANVFQQAENTKSARIISFNGKTMCMSAWAREIGIRTETLSWRLHNGWSIDKALSPSKIYRKALKGLPI